MLTQLLNKVLFWVSKHSRIWLRANYLFNTLSPTFCSPVFPLNKSTAVKTELLPLFWWCLSSCCLPSWLMINEHTWQMVLHASFLISRGWGISRKVWHSPGSLPVLLLSFAAICSREQIIFVHFWGECASLFFHNSLVKTQDSRVASTIQYHKSTWGLVKNIIPWFKKLWDSPAA